MKAKYAGMVVAICLGVVVAPFAGLFGVVWYVERQRVRDAAPAFLPLAPLGVSILSNPIPFHRYCIYYVEFPAACGLCDTNTSDLVSLNELPRQNELDLVIRTPRVTDKSLPCLEAVRKIDLLDVTESAISDEGVARLRKAFPNASVVERKSKHDNGSRPP